MLIKDRGYLLHLRQYRETSAIISVFSAEHGVIAGVLKGVSASNRSGQQLRGALQPANELDVLWLNRSGLKTIRQVQPFRPQSQQIAATRNYLCISYLNELTLKLLAEDQPHAFLFELYEQVLKGLLVSQALTDFERLLRIYESALLIELGEMPDFTEDCDGNAVVIDKMYSLIAGQGLRMCHEVPTTETALTGHQALALSESFNTREWQTPDIAQLAKQVCRYLIDHALHGKTLKSRQLYREMIVNKDPL
ncbi:DNA repair protein RecO [BD1-7 clade bacterium]|uniref:DNA repair protein RecO n=1 Tax=BD1-7 clade bacterium TaxID=2029982 RepID=A0A5S9N0C2_9GAMM|nr:DNA repair protein RecO [BD1-7 clade bacterium]